MKRSTKKPAKTVAVKITIEVVDRYNGSGPDPKTVCKGPCEGVGTFPCRSDDTNPRYRKLWKAAQKVKPSADGWHFVTCPDCGGTGKRPGAK